MLVGGGGLECYALNNICNKRELRCTASFKLIVKLCKVQIKKFCSTLTQEAASLQNVLVQRAVCTLCAAYSMCSGVHSIVQVIKFCTLTLRGRLQCKVCIVHTWETASSALYRLTSCALYWEGSCAPAEPTTRCAGVLVY